MDYFVNFAFYRIFLLIFFYGEIVGYNFDIGYEYRYEYKADSVALHDFRIRTAVKVKW